MNPIILALDSSSVMLGYCLYDGAVLASGEIVLKADDIAERCRLAFAQFNGLLELYALPDVVAMEAPATRFMKSAIPQCHVQGAIMCAASLKGLLVVSIAPAHAKLVLCGYGNAGKDAMMAAAWERYGVRGEHASDALAVALAACRRVSVERAAA
jgi:Holliday junction resolvasome RuvABC endonuclease subunit